MSDDTRVLRAQNAIQDLLRELEISLGCEVTEVKTERIETTSFQDDKKHFIKQVVIKVAPDEINTWA